MEFKGFPKIPRLNRDVVVTEKIDGTNAQVCIVQVDRDPDNLDWETWNEEWLDLWSNEDGTCWAMLAGSRNRWLTTSADNFGFAKWVEKNSVELRDLGTGQHFGEWYGSGIQRGYGLSSKHFALFNTHRWSNEGLRPGCCHVVPVLAHHTWDTLDVTRVIEDLKQKGSVHVPGWPDPEGIVVYHAASNQMFKVTCEGDMHPKSAHLDSISNSQPY